MGGIKDVSSECGYARSEKGEEMRTNTTEGARNVFVNYLASRDNKTYQGTMADVLDATLAFPRCLLSRAAAERYLRDRVAVDCNVFYLLTSYFNNRYAERTSSTAHKSDADT
jgi:hypothetical protein